MSKQPINDGGPAFPMQSYIKPNGEREPQHPGISKREYFAGQCLMGGVTREWTGAPRDASEEEKQKFYDEQRRLEAEWCYKMADDMIAAGGAA
jgi:hypothetical protein